MTGDAGFADFGDGFVISDVDVTEAERIEDSMLDRRARKSHDVVIRHQRPLADVIHAEGSCDDSGHVAVDFGVESDAVTATGARRMPIKNEQLTPARQSIS